MKYATNNPSPNSTAWPCACFVVMLLLCCSATASGQLSRDEFSTAYENALLDSLLLYTQLQHTHQNLLKAHEYTQQQNQALAHEVRVLRLQAAITERLHQQALLTDQKYRRRQRWKARLEGFLLGLLVPI